MLKPDELIRENAVKTINELIEDLTAYHLSTRFVVASVYEILISY